MKQSTSSRLRDVGAVIPSRSRDSFLPTLPRTVNPLAALRLLALGVAVLGLAGAPGSLAVAEPVERREQEQFFEREVRPLLAEHCFRCHGKDKQQGGLRVDLRGGLLAGGESGPAIVPGKPGESLLLEAVRYESLEMPPDRQLNARQVETLERWIASGAVWPGDDGSVPLKREDGFQITDEDRAFWSFQPIARPVPPHLKDRDWAVNPIDAFIGSRLEEAGLQPSPPAAPRELARRLAFDLTGLPPDPHDLASLQSDASDAGVARLVDRLLARPQYGERWARHWLDVVRFAQTNGYERDDEKPLAWRYRDYVIQAWNEDKPYDRFLVEQLAGDQLAAPGDQANPRDLARIADHAKMGTAFYRLGVWDDEPDDGRQAEFDNLDDMLVTIGTSMLGLTIGCARCHDHKFDPFPQEDYYRLLAYLRNIKPYVRPGDKAADETIFATLTNGEKTLAVYDWPSEPKPTHILVRGSAANPGTRVEPGTPRVLHPVGSTAVGDTGGPSDGTLLTSQPVEAPALEGASRRRELAEWIASPDNPLTARVIVNRLWHYHFGRGLVSTPSDFGRTGLPPSHPELLDYLASELIRGGWHIKPVQRLIVTSQTYRQSSRVANPRAETADPDNRLLWRQNMRRLEAEALRDAVLAASGQLNLQMGGRGVFPELNPQVLATQSRPGNGWEKSSPADRCRRSVYIFVKRTLRVPLLETFDGASPDTPTANRQTTTIAPQALILLNSQFMQTQSLAMADRVRREAGAEVSRQIRLAFRRALGREATPDELAVAERFYDEQQQRYRDLAESGAGESSEDERQVEPAGWNIFGGRWTLREDGGLQVRPHPGAKAIWQRDSLGDATVTAQIQLRQAAGDAGLLLRVGEAREGTDALHAYNINFQANRVRLGKHRNNWRSLAEAPWNSTPGTWQSVRVELAGPRLRVFVGGGEQPLIDFEDPDPLPAGKIGFRTYQADAAVRDIRWTAEGRPGVVKIEAAEHASDGEPFDVARRQALAAVCKLIMNLNEFVYVD